MKSRLWKLLLLTVAVLAGLLVALQWWIASRITAESITARLEEEWNCRAAVESVSVRLFAFPARVTVKGLSVLPRSEAKPAVPGETFVKVEQMLLEVNLWGLMGGELDVKRALVEGLEMQTAKWPGGGDSLRLLLAKPGTEARPAVSPVLLEDSDELPDGEGGGAAPDRPFHISELPLTSTLKEARIRNAAWTILNHRKNTVQQFKDGNFVLTGMTLDPENPARGGKAVVTASTRIVIDSKRLNLRTLDFILALEGEYQLVDPKTGNLNNDLAFGMTVKKGSLINRIPTLVKLNQRMESLKSSIGLDLSLPPEATLTADTVLRARLQDGVIRVAEDVFFPFDTYQLALDKESWLSLRDEQHRFTGRLLASGPVSTKAVAGLRGFLEKRGSAVTDLVSKTLVDRIVNKEGQVELPFESTAEIGRPEVKLSERFMDALKRAGAEAGKDLLKDFLEGGDDVNDIIDAVKGLRRRDRDRKEEKPE